LNKRLTLKTLKTLIICAPDLRKGMNESPINAVKKSNILTLEDDDEYYTKPPVQPLKAKNKIKKQNSVDGNIE